MATQTGLVCPRCGGRMLQYERTSILVDQCEECRGIYLDYGELERLIDAEGGGWSGRVGPPSDEPADASPVRIGQTRLERRNARQREKTLRDLFGG
jgi:uncharacterized protein